MNKKAWAKWSLVLGCALLGIGFLMLVPGGSAGEGGVKIGEAENETTWHFYISEDTKQEVDVNITQINDTNIIELTLFEHENSSTKNGYKWDMALCNNTKGKLEYQNEDTKGGFANADWENVNYGSVVNEGMNETWCGGGNGYTLFSSGSKNQFPKKIRLNVSEIDNFKLYAGSGSVQLDATSDVISTAYGANENICTDIYGVQHAAWERGGSDVGYGNNSGGSWTARELYSATVAQFSTFCSPNGNLSLSFINGQDLDLVYSNDNGSTWSAGAITVEDDVDSFNGPYGGAVDSNSVIHWCLIDDDDDLIYVNSGAFDSGSVISSADSDHCDIEVNSTGGVTIVMSETATDDIDVMYKPNGGSWSSRTSINNGLGAVSNVLYGGVSLAIDNDDNMHIASIHGADLQYCNGTIGSWTCNELDASNSYNPDIAVTLAGEIYIIYQAGIDQSGALMWANSSDGVTWDTETTIISSAGFGSIAQSTFPTTNNITETLHFVYTDNADTYYDNITVPYTAPLPTTLNLSIPTTASPITTSNSSNVTLSFNLTDGATPISSGVTIEEVWINSTPATIITDLTTGLTSNYNFSAQANVQACYDRTSGAPPYSGTPDDVCSDTDATSDSALDSSDDSYLTTSASSDSPSIVMITTAQENEEDISDLTFAWEGYGEIDSRDLRVYAYNYSGSSWLLLYYNSAYSGENTLIFSILDNISVAEIPDFVQDSDNDVSFIVYGNNNLNIYTDYMNTTIEYNQTTNQFAHNGTSWNVNVTMPDMPDGTYDLFLNATYGGITYDETEPASVIYGAAASNCWGTSGNLLYVPNGCTYYIPGGTTGYVG